MTDATITIESAAKLILVTLHYPGEAPPPVLLGYNQPGPVKGLKDGTYHIGLSATGQTPEALVRVIFETDASQKTRTRRISLYGTIAALVPFQLVNGKVL